MKVHKDIICPYCLRSDFATDDDLVQHLEVDHQHDLKRDEEKLSEIAIENKMTLDSWKEKQKKKLLLEAHPALLREIQRDPKLLDQLTSKHLFKEAILKGKPESTFDRMILSEFDPEGYIEVNKDGKRLKIHWTQLQDYYRETYGMPKQVGSTHMEHPESGVTEETIPIDSPNAEARKVLERSSMEELSQEDKDKIFATWIRSLRTKQKRS
jgi:hypothetical protein